MTKGSAAAAQGSCRNQVKMCSFVRSFFCSVVVVVVAVFFFFCFAACLLEIVTVSFECNALLS